MTNMELADKLQKESEHFSGAQDLVGMLWDVGAALRNLHTENTALRVTEDNLRQELQECQDQRRAAFRRIEELDAMRAQIWHGVPDVSALQMEASVIQAQKVLSDWNEWYGLNGGNAPLPPSGIVKAQEMLAEVRSLLASAPPAPQQNPLTDEQITAGAKALCKRSSEICGVNADDNWNLESEYFKDDARCVLEAAHKIVKE